MSTDRIKQHFEEAAQTLQRFLANEENLLTIHRAAVLMSETLRQGGKIISCGNGGSHCDAMHFAEELSGRYRNDRPALAAIAISDPSHLSCVGNDYGFEYVFSRYLEALGREGDVLLAISTSGNSPNVLRAAETAREKAMKIVALTGKDGGRLASLADVEIRAPHSDFADRAQEIHIKAIHAMIDCIEHNTALVF
jgi:D-sedoheptulose 7-phosphate isomerase